MPGPLSFTDDPTRLRPATFDVAPTVTPMWAPHTSLLDSTNHPSAAGQLPDLGDYRLDELLARGGMGVVYRATHRPTGTPVALKTLRLDLVNSRELAERFRREIKAAAIVHPNIMPLLEASEFDGRPFLVMPLAAEGSLAKHIKDYREPKSAAVLMAKIARGVAAAHKGGVLHRDLKPGNVLLVDGEPLVADFGLAKLVDELDTFSLTHTGSPLGTTPYMAPEQASGAKDDIRRTADIWSMGVMLYEMLTEQRPFDGGNQAATMERIHKIEPPPISSWRPDIDPGLEAIVAVCLEKKPADRYQTADELAADLERWVAGGTVTAVGRRRWRRIKKSPPKALFAGLLATIAAGIAIAYFAIRPVAPASLVIAPGAKAELTRRLDARDNIDLINGRDGPTWYSWMKINELAGTLGRRDDLILESTDIVCAALTPQLPTGYRIDAEVQQLASESEGPTQFGLFAGYRSDVVDNQPYDSFFGLTWNEEERRSSKSPQLTLIVVVRARGIGTLSRNDFKKWPLPSADSANGHPIRRVGLRIRDDRITAFLDGKPLGEVKRSDIASEFVLCRKDIDYPPEVNSEWMNGPAGFMVDRCRAAIKSVRLVFDP